MWIDKTTQWLESLSIAPLEALSIAPTAMAQLLVALGLISVIAIVTHLVLHRLFRSVLKKFVGGNDAEHILKRALFDKKLFKYFSFIIQALIIQAVAQHWLLNQPKALVLINSVAYLWILLFSVLLFFAILDVFLELSHRSRVTKELPLRGIFQGLKLVTAILAIVFAISILIGKSPAILFSGLGAMTAVLLLVFKDPLMGLVAGIQLSANKMLSLGDWLEADRYGANGAVIDITLTTVKVQNWDNTITTVPTYALISDSFINWRGMQESGGRRIMRSINIDVSSVHFLSQQEIEHLQKANLLSDYLAQRQSEIEAYNKQNELDLSEPLNGRRLTNLGTFRAYLENFIGNNPKIHHQMLAMVRQLEPTSEGIPIQIYAFTNTTAWVEYEAIQADIFDHVIAILPAFGLRLHQTPTSYDVQQIKLNINETTSS